MPYDSAPRNFSENDHLVSEEEKYNHEGYSKKSLQIQNKVNKCSILNSLISASENFQRQIEDLEREIQGQGSQLNSLDNSIVESEKRYPQTHKRKESIKISRPSSRRQLVASRGSPMNSSGEITPRSKGKNSYRKNNGSNRSFESGSSVYSNHNSYVQPIDKYEMNLPRMS